MRLGIVIPTIPGRESSLDWCIDSYRQHTRGIEVIFAIHEDSPSSGEGWLAGAKTIEDGYGPVDYLHLTNDDCEVTDDGWWWACAEACDLDKLPCPVVRNSDGSLQSAGGHIGAPDDLIRELGPDWTPVDFTTVPFLAWRQWKEIGMLPIHYGSDVFVSYRGRRLGHETVLRHPYAITHHMHQTGRGAGMTQAQRTVRDRHALEQALALP